MRTRRESFNWRLGLGLAALALSSLALRGAAPRMLCATPEAVGMSSERLQQATALLRQAVADRAIAGAVAAVARHGKIIYLEPVGLQDLQTRTPMTEGSLFRIYSMTKAVTAVAVMMLQDEGKLKLTDRASKYLPAFRNVVVREDGTGAPRHPAREITIQDLLLHTSGLNHRTSDLYKNLQVRYRHGAIHHQHHQSAAHGRSRTTVSLQRGDNRAGWHRRSDHFTAA